MNRISRKLKSLNFQVDSLEFLCNLPFALEFPSKHSIHASMYYTRCYNCHSFCDFVAVIFEHSGDATREFINYTIRFSHQLQSQGANSKRNMENKLLVSVFQNSFVLENWGGP